ncbi:baseplate assembly protein [Roseospira marina]|uniref:Baseplate assembly protein n=1 Tax=Roseospira marina TaxID=140057 RepID=A0A5M6I4U4_9PROT|nr:baseplate J/gp47 family protein [Roseospira marina]KAA5602798.1 baseplate assembly protein [Roseospira marina]MBB4316223.1 phage-related baseplate assembly protein [Roseospira marina]MBB5089426.1 phage-related baseplate assembly protein [Roseospira marina]
MSGAVIDLSATPPPDVVEAPDYEVILARMLAETKAALAEVLPDWDPTSESDSLVIQIQRWAEDHLNMIVRINDAARAVLLATAMGADLDNLAALVNTVRLTVAEATDTDPAVLETDAALRARVQLAWEGLSTAGPVGAYRYHALAADGRVRDAAITSPTPGDVVVTILGHEGDGTVTEREIVTDRPVTFSGDTATLEGAAITGLIVTGADAGTDYRFDPETRTLTRVPGGTIPAGGTVAVSYERAGVLAIVAARLRDDDVRPLTDRVTVQSATIVPYTVKARLWLYAGPSAAPVLGTAVQALTDRVAALHALGHDVTRSALFAALHQPGVQRVELIEPAADLVIGPGEAAWCVDIDVTVGGRDV